MGRKKNDIKYDTIKIPEGLTNEVDKIMLESKGMFTSRPDVIKYVVRKYIDERRLDDGKRIEARQQETASPARIDGKQSKLTGDGLAKIEGRSEGTDKDSKDDAGNKQPDVGESREGTEIDLGRAA